MSDFSTQLAKIEDWILDELEGSNVFAYRVYGGCSRKHLLFPVYDPSTGMPFSEYAASLIFANGLKIEGTLPLPNRGISDLGGAKAISIGFNYREIDKATRASVRVKVQEAVSQLLAG